jgi:hypothetical protein
VNQENNDWLRRKKDQLYLEMIDLMADSDRLKKLAKIHDNREYRHKFLQVSYAIDDQVDDFDETCFLIELHLKNIGKKK